MEKEFSFEVHFNTFPTFTLVSGWQQPILQYCAEGNTCGWEGIAVRSKDL